LPLALFSVMVWFSACSTEKNAAVNKGYHNMTAHYNGYFNAREIIKESLKVFREGYKEDYSAILPIYLYADEKAASTLYTDMDRAITKTSTVITKHSMPNPEKNKNKKEEWCKWIDDNWLVMGQAHFYKREFDAALEKFSYIYKTYKDADIQYEAQIWMVRTYMEMGNMTEASRILERLQRDANDAEEKVKESKKDKGEKKTRKKPTSKGKKKSNEKEPASFPPRLKRDLIITQADYYIRKKDYEKAAEKLVKGIEMTKKKREKARLTFILAQLYQAQGKNSLASETYAKIPKMNPTFEMEFYARINRALLYEGGDSRGIRAELMKLLRDEKNKEYFDQIYYALAELELKDDKRDQGVGYLKKSIAVSVSNERQKGRSYLRLGDLHFNDRDYVPAKNFFDSSLAFLPKTFPDYEKIKKKSESLSELVTHLNTITLQDSLLNLASLSPKKRQEAIDKIVEKEKEEEEAKRRAEEAKIQQGTTGPTVAAESGGWYIYNQQAKTQGFNEFKKLWGARKLEDDWRRSNKTSVSEEEISNTGDSALSATDAKYEKRREQLLSSIPNGPEQISESKKKLQEAYYKSGVIFKDRFQQKDLAIKQFKSLIDRFDYGEYVLPANYQLYLIYNPSPQSEAYKNTILNDYADSEYARLIRNPNAMKEEEELEKKQEVVYLQAYKLYREKRYSESLEACNQIIQSEPQNSYLSRYYFLRAMNYGEMKQMDKLESSLSECAEKYAAEDTGKEAQSILDYLRNKRSKENPIQGFVYEAEAEHYFMMIFTSDLGSINDGKAAFSDFNSQYFSNADLKVSNGFLNMETQTLVVKQFPNRKKAMEYYQAYKNENDRLKKYKGATCFMITGKNNAAFMLERDVEKYMSFFTENYLK